MRQLKRVNESRKQTRDSDLYDRIWKTWDKMSESLTVFKKSQQRMNMVIDAQNHNEDGDPEYEGKTFDQWESEADEAMYEMKDLLRKMHTVSKDLRKLYEENKKNPLH